MGGPPGRRAEQAERKRNGWLVIYAGDEEQPCPGQMGGRGASGATPEDLNR